MNPKKLLIVEDDFFIRDLYEIQARASGFNVSTATDSMKAISKAKVEIPNIILLDLMLPKMDGVSVVKNLKLILNRLKSQLSLSQIWKMRLKKKRPGMLVRLITC